MSMDAKWEAFIEHQRLFLHRSWTGHGIYVAQFAQTDDGESLILELIIEAALLGRFHEEQWASWFSRLSETIGLNDRAASPSC